MSTAAPISRHSSTNSLLNTLSNDAMVQSLNLAKEAIAQGCDKILAAKSIQVGKGTVKMDDQANKYLCDHIVRLIATLCTPTLPVKIADVDSRIQNGLGIASKLMPTAKNLEEFKGIAERGKKRQLHIPADKIFNVFKDVHSRFDQTVSLYIVAILEHITSNLLQMAMNYEAKMAISRNISNESIKLSSMQTLLALYWNDEEPSPPKDPSEFVQRFPEDYDNCAKELQFFLNTSIEQISLIIRLFREPVNSLFPQTPDRQTIFGNIEDIINNLRMLEDAIEDMFESNTNRLVGSCFIEPAEDDSLNCFANYGKAIFNPECKARLSALSENRDLVNKLVAFSQTITQTVNKVSHKRGSEPEVRSWQHQCEGCVTASQEPNSSQHEQPPIPVCNFMVNSFKYLLPRLLLLPVFHFLYMVEILERLSHRTSDDSDRIHLNEVNSMLMPSRIPLQRGIDQHDWIQMEKPRLAFFMRTQHSIVYNGRQAKKKLDNIEKMIRRGQDTWERPTGIFEFVLEDSLQIRYENKRLSERYIYLFTAWMLVCKRTERKTGIGDGRHANTILKVKKRIILDQFHMIDVRPSDDRDCPKRCQFEMEHMTPNGPQRILFVAKSYEQKVDLFTTLLTLQTHKTFTKYLRELPKTEIPLRLPTPDKYRFAEPDSPNNILLEDSTSENSADIPVIKAATLAKLIERITYHAYFDSKTLNSFMLVFRNFTTPNELLDLLIERFDIPEPEFTDDEMSVSYDENDTKAKQMLKRFRITYMKRVQIRVMNVFIHWVRNTEYFQTDFANDEELKKRLSEFLDTVESRHLQDGVRKIQKHLSGFRVPVNYTFDNDPPKIIDVNLCSDWTEVKLTNIHPVEFARQITLYEWELYGKISYWEVSGKEKTTQEAAPNLYKSQDFSNKLKCWMVFSVMCQDNMEDRGIVIERIVDLMKIFESMNNMQGAQEAKGALISASVYRLYHTHEVISKSRMYKNVLDLLRKQCSDRNDMYTVEYQKKIRRLNPPCVPFIAFGGKTVLIHNKLANPDIVYSEDGTVALINFKKHRQSGEVVDHYMSFQKTPYNCKVDPMLRTFLENLDPFQLASVSDEHTFDDYAFNRSMFLEPKNCAINDFPEFESSLNQKEHRFATELRNTSFEDKIAFVGQDAPAPQEFNHGGSMSTLSSTMTLSSNPSGPKSPSPKPRLQSDSFVGGGDPDKAISPIIFTRPPVSYSHKPVKHGTSPPSNSPIRVVPAHQHSMSDSHVNSATPTWDGSLAPPPLPPRTGGIHRSRELSQSLAHGDVFGSSTFNSDTVPPPVIPPRIIRTQTTQRPLPLPLSVEPHRTGPGGQQGAPALPPRPQHRIAAPALPPRAGRKNCDNPMSRLP